MHQGTGRRRLRCRAAATCLACKQHWRARLSCHPCICMLHVLLVSLSHRLSSPGRTLACTFGTQCVVCQLASCRTAVCTAPWQMQHRQQQLRLLARHWLCCRLWLCRDTHGMGAVPTCLCSLHCRLSAMCCLDAATLRSAAHPPELMNRAFVSCQQLHLVACY